MLCTDKRSTNARGGLRTIGLLTAALGLMTLAGAADAAPRQRQSDCGTTIIRNVSNHGAHRHNRVTQINRGHVSRVGHQSSHRSQGDRGRSGSFFSISVGSGSRHNSSAVHFGTYSGSRSLAHRVSRQTSWHRPLYGSTRHSSYGHSRSGYHSKTVIIDRSCPPPRVVVERPVIVERPVVVERPVYIERSVPIYREIPRDAFYEHRVGWNALLEGDFALAREYFIREVARRPNDVPTRAGLAIARAASGFDDQADWAMRRAVRSGLNRAAAFFPAGELDHLLRELEDRYTERALEYNDRWFMVASLRYLQGDAPGAARAADRALDADRHDTDAERLYQISRYGA